MAKRAPAGRLTQDNWDEEDDSEEAGHFTTASKEKLAERVIKKAKRRGPTGEIEGSGGLFKGFSGFVSSTGQNGSLSGTAAPPFSFGAKPETSANPTFSFSSKPLDKNVSETKSVGAPLSVDSKSDSSEYSQAYLSDLKGLNRDFSKWIQDHIAKNPYCVFTPCFVDYANHLAKIEAKCNLEKGSIGNGELRGGAVATATVLPTMNTPASSSSFPTALPSSFGILPASSSFSTSVSSTTLVSNSSTASKPLTFGSSAGLAASGTTAGFSFGLSTGSSSVGSAVAGASSSAAADTGATEEEEYVPPKVEVREIREDGSVFTIRCKLFYKSGTDWKDKGVGNLHLKNIDSGKAQLIIRADTNLGNLLLNILLTKDVPFIQNKNNINLVCVPTPPVDASKADSKEPVSMLIRVKDAEKATNLLAEVDKIIK